jgi:hypothetical protein
VHWKIGLVPIGGTVEVVEFGQRARSGLDRHHRHDGPGRFRLRDGGPGQTKVTFRLTYQAPGGLLGLIADRVAARQVRRTLAESLRNLETLVES